MNNLSNFSERLNEFIFERNLTVSDVSDLLNVSKISVYRYLKNAQSPTTDILIKLSDYFNCSTDYLVGKSNQNTSYYYKNAPAFSQRLNELFVIYKTTEYKASKTTKISRSLFFAWLNGKSLPTLPSIIKLAEYFNCSIDYLLGRE